MKLIQSLQRAFDIIDCFDEVNETLTLTEISEKLDLNINTTRGLVNTLLHHCYLDHNEYDNSYQLGYIFKEKYDLLSQRENNIILDNVEEFLEDLANDFVVTARLHLVRNNSLKKIISKTSEDSRYILYVADSKNLPLNATSSGKLILYFSDEDFKKEFFDKYPREKLTEFTKTSKEEILEELDFIKENKYSKEIDETGIGISSLALPIVSKDKLLGTISTTGPSFTIENNKDEIIKTISSFINENYKNLINK